ncbi:LmeA family phospholipid-binding protein [bacterium]|nr:LmeA family phospholipid-binding protein [bacterium]
MAKRWRWLVGIIAGLIVLVLGGFAVVQAVLLPRLTTMLANAVRRELSLPAEATVDIELGGAAATVRGHLPGFHVESPSAVIDDLACDLLKFDATNVDFNLRQIIRGDKAEITAVESARITLRVPAEELKSRLVPLIEQEGLEQVEIEFESDAVKVTAKRKVKFIGKVKLAAKGRFFIEDGTRIRLKVTDIEAGQLNLGVGKLGIELSDTLPALDLGGMFADVVIDELELTRDHLRITAHTVGVAGGIAPADAIEVF